MDLAKSDFDFLDLSDLQGEEELNSLRNVLFNSKPNTTLSRAVHVQYNQLSIEYSSCSSSTEGPTTVSSSLDSLSGGECEMAPHSPQRGAAAGPPPPVLAPPPPPPYAQPPPAYAPPPPPQWPVAPPNVYVSQVTANVNVHGYMGQYYQPPQQHYAPPPPPPPAHADRPPRNHRRDRRGKRAPSPPPPQPPPPYYVQYPPYYSAAQAQGAPLYHLPMYQPLVYGPYTYPQYYTDYPIPVEGDAVEKGPDEYAPEVVMEQEAVEAYYGAHYGGPHYGPPVDSGVEYIPSMYLQPPPQPPPIQLQQPPHQTTPHQFNVHAKNFVQMQNKSYTPQEKSQEQKPSPTATVTASATSASVETIAIKDLKISNKRPSSPKQNDRVAEIAQVKQEKASPAPKIESVKTPQTSSENKVSEVTNTGPTPTVTKSFTATASASNQYAATKLSPAINKTSKGPAAPFSGGKQTLKSSAPQAAVPTQQAASTPKPPFGNRQKRDGPTTRSPSAENADSAEKAAAPVEQQPHVKRDPPLPQSKAPMLSITLNSQGPPLIVTNKSPFGHSRKSAAPPVPEPPPAPQPPPPAPTASDFPPPPTPRNRGEPAPLPAVAPQPQPAPGKSWASLFNKSSNGTAVPAAATTPAPLADDPQRPPSPAVATPPPSINVQKPVAKVPPFDASPLQVTAEKAPATVAPAAPAPVPAPAPAVSYSEKTSVNAVRGASLGPPAAAAPTSNPPSPVQKEPTPALPVATSPFADDPNSYRMGEFLSKYSLDHRAAALLPRGLTNRSNYCYVNAILQALIACPPFYNLLKALPYQTRKGKSSTPVIDSMVELCYEFSRSATRPARGEAGGAGGAGGAAGGAGAGLSPPAPPPLEGGAGLRVLRALSPFVGSQEGRQEDAEEFLGCLLNSLNDEMLELIKLVEPEEPKDVSQQNGIIAQDQTPEEDDDDHEWKVMGPRNKGAVERRWAAARTPVADIFRGRTRLRLHRAHAHAHASHHDVSDAVQPFFTLQLDIERAGTVKEALEQLANKDTLEGVSDAWQQLALEQLPVVLLLHLKCFQLAAGGHTAKIVKGIDFPIDLKIDPKIMSSKAKYTSKQRLYKLFAVVYHEGVEAVKGHYVADTYHGQAGWIRFDDSTVTQVTDVQVLKPKPPRMPYLLMYRRHDTLPQHRPKPE